MKKTIGILVILALIVIVSISGNKKQEEVKKIAILQYVTHPAFDEVTVGIRESLAKAGFKEGKNITLDIQNGNGDNSTIQSIAQKFANQQDDLIVPYGTAPSQAVLNLVKNRPIVFAAVTDPITAGLVNDPQKPGANITGTSDITLYKESLELLKKLVPNAKKIGVLQNPGEANSVFALSETQKYAKELGLEIIVGTVNSSNEVYQAAKAISGKVDAFYVSADVTVTSGINGLIKATLESKRPLIAFTNSDVEAGALASLGTNYKKVGEKTGEIAVRVLKGENPGDIPVLGVTDADIFINKKTAEAIGLTISEEILKSAKTVY